MKVLSLFDINKSYQFKNISKNYANIVDNRMSAVYNYSIK